MPITDYFPSRDNDQSIWAKTLSDNIPADGTTAGLSATQISSVQDACKAIINAISDNDVAQKTALKATESKKEIVSNSKKTLRAIVNILKASPNYTADLGKHLGIIGTHQETDMENYSPVLEAVAFPGHVTIKFTKKGVDGVNIYMRLKGETNWTKIALDLHSPYIDNRPLAEAGKAENREYMGIGVLNDAEIGQMSKIASVVFGG